MGDGPGLARAPLVITVLLTSESRRPEKSQEKRCDDRSRGRHEYHYWLDDGKGPQAKECEQPLGFLRDEKKGFPPGGSQPCTLNLAP